MLAKILKSIRGDQSGQDPAPITLAQSYRGMYDLHAGTHIGAIAELARLRDMSGLSPQILEVACGSGENIATFLHNGFEYSGLDISETAIQLAMEKHPRGSFLNIRGSEMSLLRDSCFDVVYNSSMLEHVGEHEELLSHMIRLAKRHLFVLFYEGLSEQPTKIDFHPLNDHPPSPYGVKFVDYQLANKGWFMNRYARADILNICSNIPNISVEILDRSNRPYIAGTESILHIQKR